MESTGPDNSYNDKQFSPASIFDVIPLEELQQLQDILAQINAVTAVMTDPAGLALTMPSNEAGICRSVQRNTAGAAACFAHQASLTQVVANTGEPLCARCRPLGFMNAVIPIFIGDAHLANWWIRKPCAHPEVREALISLCGKTGLEQDKPLRELEALPDCNPSEFQQIVGWVQNLTANIFALGHKNLLLTRDVHKLYGLENELKRYKAHLEGFVQERTAELIRANTMLQLEVMERDLAEEQIERKSRLLDAINKVLQQTLTDRSPLSLQRVFLKAAQELTNSPCGFVVERKGRGWRVSTGRIQAPVCPDDDTFAAGDPIEPTGVWQQLIGKAETLIVLKSDALSGQWMPSGFPAVKTLLAVPFLEHSTVVGFIALCNSPSGYAPVDRADTEALTRVFLEALLRKRSEQAKHHNELRLNLALESANEGLWDFLPQEQKLYLSPSCFTMLGYRDKEFPSSMESWQVLTHPDDFPGLENCFKNTSTGGQEGFGIDIRMLAQGGTWSWIQVRGRIVDQDKQGNVLRVVGTLSDISKYKQVELALQKANEELQRLAVLDGLTQIANRLRFDDRLVQEWRRARRERKPLAVVLCDIDYFKDYNDFYGHLQGDDVLYRIAQTISATLKRPMDLIARYGGEEFAMVLPNTDLEGAVRVAREVKAAIDALKIEHKASKAGAFISLSFGVSARIPNDKQTPRSLVEAADTALYKAKNSGRNRIIKIPEALSARQEHDGRAA